MSDESDQTESRCPVCGGTGRFAYRATDRLHDLPGEYDYVDCTNCGAVFQAPTPTATQIASFYPEEYAPYRPGKQKQPNPIESAVLRSCYGYTHLASPLPDWLGRLLGMLLYRDSIPFVSDGRLLDVGCGGGKYLLAMQRIGWQPQGVEFNEQAVATCRQSGLEVFQGELADAGLPDDSFDLVTARHVIEHIADPAAFVAEIARVLKPGGMLVIKTPNAQALGRRWFGVDWYANDVPRHLILFSPANLRLLAEKQGLREDLTRTFSTPKIFLNSWDYRFNNPSESSKRKKLRRMFARLYVMSAALTGNGDEVFSIFRKSADAG